MAEKCGTTPFLKQLFVTSGMCLNVGQFGLVAGYVVAIVPQLQEAGASIPMDESIGSWFASAQALTIFIGYALVPYVISTYGRRPGSIISSSLVQIGWIFILLADTLSHLLIGRILQGISLGFALCQGPIIIAECTSPRFRGIFLASSVMSLSVCSAVIHYLGSFLHWRSSALFCTFLGFVDLIIVLYSPETPSWLASKGRYEESKTVYRWLRGANEEEELLRLIQANSNLQTAEPKTGSIIDCFKSKLAGFSTAMRKREVYKSVTVGIHLLIMAYWSGSTVFGSYPLQLVHYVVGHDVNAAAIILSIDINRFFVSLLSVYVVRKVKRKSMLLSSAGLCITSSFVLAGYVYAKNNLFVPDIPFLSITLLHIHSLAISIGAMPVPIIIMGEIYPLQYRSVASAFTRMTSCVHLFAVNKSFPDIVRNVGITGSYCISGGLCLYSLVVSYILLPETKDRTLHDIEQEFRGKTGTADSAAESFI